ncbi:MAG: enoyl-CoA hydratase-related protein [Acidobacteriota bacterium]
MSYETINVAFEEGCFEIALHRPDVLNALDQKMAEELCDALDWAAGRNEVRSVLLYGEGRAFCAGGDLKAMATTLDRNPAEFFEEPLAKIHEAALSLARLPKPTVGAIHGFASGAGFNLALCCDLRVAGVATRFNQAFVRIGAVPDTGGSYFLTRLIGPTRALEAFFLGDFIEASRALELGIVNRVVDEDKVIATGRDLARKLATGPTQAYAEIKKLVFGSSTSSLAAALDAEQQAQLRVASTHDLKEGIRSFFEKRPPKYRGA